MSGSLDVGVENGVKFSMDLTTGHSKVVWQPEMTADTTAPSYWLNWRFFICAFWIISFMVVSSYLIWKYEGSNRSKSNEEEARQETKVSLYEDEVWKPCLTTIHPSWLLGFRVIAFFLLIALLIANATVDGGAIFYYYTQWTFLLVIIYFGLGSVLSIRGCYQYCNKVGGDHLGYDTEQGSYAVPTHEENANGHDATKNSNPPRQNYGRKPADIWGLVFQVIFQMAAGAVLLTDFVFWFLIVPFLAIKDYDLNFMLIGVHSVNAIFLFGDTAFNCLRFPWFRIAYFILWTAVFVIFQWIVHGCISLWWPYPFLDLSSPYAPVWYLAVGLMHIPCYSLFALIIRSKHFLWLKYFPQSYQCSK
ncbi:hypothetical protein Sjap_016136 [Stephania japonica]|uniref:Transmembrane protein n=1 Tax=Stephania japonica TaxID=461633 RepID=A0AAP0NT77_9MAGN